MCVYKWVDVNRSEGGREGGKGGTDCHDGLRGEDRLIAGEQRGIAHHLCLSCDRPRHYYTNDWKEAG